MEDIPDSRLILTHIHPEMEEETLELQATNERGLEILRGGTSHEFSRIDQDSLPFFVSLKFFFKDKHTILKTDS